MTQSYNAGWTKAKIEAARRTALKAIDEALGPLGLVCTKAAPVDLGRGWHVLGLTIVDIKGQHPTVEAVGETAYNALCKQLNVPVVVRAKVALAVTC